ncbi:putative oxidoreductase [Symbiodinium microadriaticum]|uniref:Putative oxidoreductase n=1 Tax=Symbiodinium microadriaticum TaxID=2951 RepID=A0A1Q9CV04_SYMMI|nr:putative oxidoreductase [Symbiodinium microadriaticum]
MLSLNTAPPGDSASHQQSVPKSDSSTVSHARELAKVSGVMHEPMGGRAVAKKPQKPAPVPEAQAPSAEGVYVPRQHLEELQRRVLTLQKDLDAPASAVESAFRRRSLDCHPDKRPGDPTAKAKFEALAAAKESGAVAFLLLCWRSNSGDEETLLDPDKRAAAISEVKLSQGQAHAPVLCYGTERQIVQCTRSHDEIFFSPTGHSSKQLGRESAPKDRSGLRDGAGISGKVKRLAEAVHVQPAPPWVGGGAGTCAFTTGVQKGVKKKDIAAARCLPLPLLLPATADIGALTTAVGRATGAKASDAGVLARVVSVLRRSGGEASLASMLGYGERSYSGRKRSPFGSEDAPRQDQDSSDEGSCLVMPPPPPSAQPGSRPGSEGEQQANASDNALLHAYAHAVGKWKAPSTPEAPPEEEEDSDSDDVDIDRLICDAAAEAGVQLNGALATEQRKSFLGRLPADPPSPVPEEPAQEDSYPWWMPTCGCTPMTRLTQLPCEARGEILDCEPAAPTAAMAATSEAHTGLADFSDAQEDLYHEVNALMRLCAKWTDSDRGLHVESVAPDPFMPQVLQEELRTYSRQRHFSRDVSRESEDSRAFANQMPQSPQKTSKKSAGVHVAVTAASRESDGQGPAIQGGRHRALSVSSSRQRRHHRLLGPKKGLAVHFGHENWNMVLSMMIGIRMSVGRSGQELHRELQPVDFIMKGFRSLSVGLLASSRWYSGAESALIRQRSGGAAVGALRMPDEDFDPWATAVADGTSSALKKASKKKDVWGSFRAGEAEALSDSEAPKPGKQGSGKKKKGDSKKPSGPSGPNLARRRVMDHKISGSVESWSNTYGWIRPFQHVGHPKANKHGGKLYIHAKDLVGGVGFLPTGASVEFYVFEDDAGLGAEECALAEWNGKGGKGWGSKGWDAGKGWGKGMWDMGKGWAKGMWGGFDGWTGGGKKGWDGGKGLSGKGKDSKSSGKGEWGGKERSKGGDGAKGAGAKDGKGKASKGSTQTVAPKEPQPGVSDFDQVHSDWSHYTGLGGLAASATGPSAGSGFAAATGCTGQLKLVDWPRFLAFGFPAVQWDRKSFDMVVQWGILGCAGIARKFCASVSRIDNAVIAAVASRTAGKADDFIAENCPGSKAYASYEELLADASIEAVYIPVPTSVKTELVLKVAAAKKHVLVEKPLASAADVKLMIDACRAAGVQFMDNTMFLHNARQDSIKSVLSDGGMFGDLRHVDSTFSIDCANDEAWAADNIRMKRSLEPLGCLGDLGWYDVRLTLWAFQYSLPTSVSCTYVEHTEDMVPTHLMAQMRFGNKTGSFMCSFKSAFRNSAEFVGSKAVLSLEDFVVTGKLETASYKVTQTTFGAKAETFPLVTLKDEELKTGVQHAKLVETFSGLVASGKVDETWPEQTYQTQLVLDAMVKSAEQGPVPQLGWKEVSATSVPGQPIASAAGTAPLLGASANMKPMGGKPLQGVPEASWSEVAPPAPYLMNSVGPALPAMGSMHVNPVPYGSYSMMPGMLNPTVPQQVAMSNPDPDFIMLMCRPLLQAVQVRTNARLKGCRLDLLELGRPGLARIFPGLACGGFDRPESCGEEDSCRSFPRSARFSQDLLRLHVPNSNIQTPSITRAEKFSILPRLANIFDATVSKRVKVTRFIDYAPMVFQRIRASFGIHSDDYLRSVGPEQLLGNMVLGNLSSLSELSSEGKSGAFFYYTSDGKYMMKTVTHKEQMLLKKMLKKYYDHITQNQGTLLVRFLGLHCLSVHKNRKGSAVQKVYFVVMGNMFNTPFEIHRRYDLKGSWVGRVTKEEDKDPSVALKDVDFTKANESILVGAERKAKLVAQIEKDSIFLRDNNIIDYSLLLGVYLLGGPSQSTEEKGENPESCMGLRGASATPQMATGATVRMTSSDDLHGEVPFHQAHMGGMLSSDQKVLYFLGIIDILTPYDSRKHLEHWFKALRYDRKGVSCCPPAMYAERFSSFLKNCIH